MGSRGHKAVTIRQAAADGEEYVAGQTQTTVMEKENTEKTAPGEDKAESKSQ